MQPEMTQLLVMLAEALSPFLVALASYCAYQGANWLKQRVKHEKASVALGFAQHAVVDVVAAGGEAFQLALRKAAEDGVVTKAEALQIRDAALSAARAQAGDEVMAGLKSITSDPDSWLWTKIQAEAHFSKDPMPSDDDILS